MAKDQARGLSLWLMVEGPAREQLEVWIERLARRFGTFGFLPHLTLAQGLVADEAQALGAAAHAAADILPFVVTLGGVGGRDEHFRCVFLRAEGGPELRAAHATAARAFGRAPDPGFLPHVSLVYGTLASAEKREVGEELAEILPIGFEARRLQLWRTEGPVGEWRELGTFAFGPRAARQGL